MEKIPKELEDMKKLIEKAQSIRDEYEKDIHGWFELSYSNYLVLPRSLMEGMPKKWQVKFVKLLEEMREIYDCDKIEDNYTVKLRDENGRFKKDPLCNYRHPGKLPHKKKES